MITQQMMFTAIILAVSMIPFITYIDYYLLSNMVICEKCGTKPPKHTWLLSTFLEMFMFILGCLLGLLVVR